MWQNLLKFITNLTSQKLLSYLTIISIICSGAYFIISFIQNQGRTLKGNYLTIHVTPPGFKPKIPPHHYLNKDSIDIEEMFSTYTILSVTNNTNRFQNEIKVPLTIFTDEFDNSEGFYSFEEKKDSLIYFSKKDNIVIRELRPKEEVYYLIYSQYVDSWNIIDIGNSQISGKIFPVILKLTSSKIDFYVADLITTYEFLQYILAFTFFFTICYILLKVMNIKVTFSGNKIDNQEHV